MPIKILHLQFGFYFDDRFHTSHSQLEHVVVQATCSSGLLPYDVYAGFSSLLSYYGIWRIYVSQNIHMDKEEYMPIVTDRAVKHKLVSLSLNIKHQTGVVFSIFENSMGIEHA